MSQAYQAPQDFNRLSSDRAKPLMQRPSPKLLARRAVATQGQRPVQPQRLPGLDVSGLDLSSVMPVGRVQSPRPGAVRPPAVNRQPAKQPAPRLTIDWRARLQEARDRLAARQAQAPQAKAPVAKKPVAKAPSPKAPSKIARSINPAIGSPKIGSRRAGSVLTDPITSTPIPSAPIPNSRSVRRGQEQQPVIRGNEVRPAVRPRQSSDQLLSRAPRSGSQQYIQRLNALRNGQLYTQIPRDSFYEQWSQATQQPTYEQWRELLALEARAAGRNKGQENLTAMVGDSLSQWFPADRLPDQQVWLNQGISGDTTSGILNRLNALDSAQPDIIYLMAGVNDLKRGANEQQVLRNINQILSRLKQQHPTAQIVVQSILPTRSEQIPNDRIVKLNPLIQQLAQRHGVNYLDLAQQFRDDDGGLRADLTTDGIHLSAQGYQVWQLALQRMDQRLAQRPTRTIAQAQTP